MQLLASAGRQVQAVRQYHQLRAALREELDVEPAVETQALLEYIQRR
jgi:DNA-binding SARP family transcriptional activator